uniref:RanBD1 domain-containing protein n=1 Tax=Panagrellus redivivus TaxID=6233 RepID=A0A7E4USL5_PANRE
MKSVKSEGPSEATMETIAIALQRIELSVDKQNNDLTRRLNGLEARLEGIAALITKSDASNSQAINGVLTNAINQLAAVSQAAIDRDRALAVSNDNPDAHTLGQLLTSMRNQQANNNQQVQLQQQQQQMRLQMQYQQLCQAYAVQQQQQQGLQQQQPSFAGFPVLPGPQVPGGSLTGGFPVPSNVITRPQGPVVPPQQQVAPPPVVPAVPGTPVKSVFPNFNITKGSPVRPTTPLATSSLATTSVSASPAQPQQQQPLTLPKVSALPTPTTTAAPTPSIFGIPPPAAAPVVAPAVPVVSSGALAATAPTAPAEEHEGEDEPEAFQPTAHYEPVIPLPALVNVSTGEEGAEVLFEGRGKLFRWCDIDDGKKGFKERGIGQVKILRNPGAKNARVVMRREQVLKVCANHIISSTCKLTRNNGKPAITYPCKDFSEGELTDEIFSIRFKDDETVNKFIEVFEAQKGTSTSDSDATPKASPQKPAEAPKPPTTGFGDKFKKQAGEWECNTCYVVNKASDEFCESCNTGRDGSSKKETLSTFKPAAPAAGKPAFSFGIPSTGAAASAATSTPETKPAPAATPAFSFKPQATTTAAATPETKPAAALFGKPLIGATSTPDAKPAVPSTFAGFGSKPATPAQGSITTGTSALAAAASKPLFGAAATTTASPPKTETTPAVKPAAALNFSFGKPTTPATDKVETPFKFNPTPTQQAAKPATSTFGGAGVGSPATGAGSTFGGTKLFGNSAAPAASTGFGSPNPSLSFSSLASGKSFLDKQAETPADANKSFGAQSGFLRGAQAPNQDTERAEGDEAAESPEDFVPDAEYAPVVPLPDKVEVVTGEEGEEVLFEHKGKLFIYLPETKETKERGTGPVKILYNPTTKAHRVVMRRDQVHKICANFRLQKNAGMTCGDKPGIRNCCIFRAVDFTDSNEGTNVLFLLRFREDEVYNDFKTQFNNIVGPISSTESA